MPEPSLVPLDYWLDEDDDRPDEERSCAQVNGSNGDCVLGRETCRGCKYNT